MTITEQPLTRHAAWDSVGSWVQTPEHQGLTAREVLTEAGLDWTVSKEPAFTDVLGPEGVTRLELPKVANVRIAADGTPLGIVGVNGPDYSIVQNTDMVDLLDGIVDGAGASFEAAGDYRNHSNVFVAMRLPCGFSVGNDQTDGFLFAENTHDGSGSYQISATMLRINCTNQISSIRKGSDYRIRFRHTKNLQATGERVRAALNLVVKATTELSAQAQSLVDQSLTDAEFRRLTETLLPIDPEATDRVIESRLDARESIWNIWNGETVANIAGTRWAAWNAVSEYDQWFRPVRGASRAERQLENRLKGDTLTDRAGELLLV
jgi:phage/plasmid-like protein (TIGR03299 family)